MNPLMLWFHKSGSPPEFYRLAGRFQPWLWALALIFGVIGLYLGLLRAPADYLQGESARIMYIHVPSAWMSMFIFAFMAFCGVLALVWHVKISEVLLISAAPIGVGFTAVTLITGSLWGRPTWGTYWEWDARMTSELVLLFLYFGVLGLFHAFDDRRKGARAASLLALIGLVNLPIIHYSVTWWNSLHQGSSINLMTGTSAIDASMLWPLLIMTLASKLWFGASLMQRARVEVIDLESGKDWVQALLPPTAEKPKPQP
ncbi:MAG: heme ABC transporter permease [Lysobacterales bacterium CG02_land_8_20_14_3_00_62_12]|nr:MAG: heme ABC transporter permease [Xanthomonadales bacterium CG02_land_8_20_14_3_00_62_12]